MPAFIATLQAKGNAKGKATAYVPQLVPVENAIVTVKNINMAGRT